MIDFDKVNKYKKYFGEDNDPRLLNPSESTRINNPYIKEKALKPTQKVDPDRFEIESLFPGIGDAMDLVDIEEAISDKNYGQAALGAGLLLVPNAIEKPLKMAGKAIKQGIKKYGTKAANKIENILPSVSDKFHTWNIKDNIKNAAKEDVINAKKSRLLERPANDLDLYNKIRFGNTNYNREAKEFLADQFAPQGNNRVNKINNPNVVKFSTNFDIAQMPSPLLELYTDGKVPLSELMKDVRLSMSNRKHITVGNRIYKADGTFEKLNDFNFGTIYNHELDHYISIPSYSDKNKLKNLTPLLDHTDPYNNTLNKTELKARLGQMLDYYLVEGKNPISKSQLKSAIKVRTHPNVFKLIDNPLKGEVKQLKNINLDKLLETINTMSLKHGGKISI